MRGVRSWAVPLVVLSALFFCAACEKEIPIEQRPVLVVNGESLGLGAFYQAFEREAVNAGDLPEGSPQRLREQVSFLQRMADRMVLDQYARTSGVKVDEKALAEEVQRLKSGYDDVGFEQMLVERQLTEAEWVDLIRSRKRSMLATEQALATRIAEPTEEELREYYEAHIEEFSQPKQVHARQILVDSAEKAEELRTEIRRGADFAEVARANSLSPDASSGGDLGYFSAGYMPVEFDQAVFMLRPGRVSKVVASPYGYHLFLVEDIRQPHQVSFEEAREEIRERLRTDRMREVHDKWLHELRKQANIEFHAELLMQ
ncbi:MAG: peptidyl-prolyl cis-trans isomerase [Chrysiogenetes bacterium]|nr:peptidyl-prolyl cis-trans isomerase [Chrysiogenetes bacterium]